ncbi:MAG: class I SAM-dependent methyltransferase [Myxococcales bacterium]|nr:class I SAM-dependent methyltransferase [Myxococcales bacterium]
MSFYGEQVLPRVTEWILDRPKLEALRRETARGLFGEVVEIGFGSGLNLPVLPAEVRRLHAVDPDRTGPRLAAARLAASDVPVDFVGLDGRQIPLDAQSMDAALSTFTMCSIPELERALREVRRVLKPGARLHFLEHGLSNDARVARWQRRVTPLYSPFAGGCRFDVPIADAIRAAGFEIESLDARQRKGPKLGAFLYQGVARKV